MRGFPIEKEVEKVPEVSVILGNPSLEALANSLSELGADPENTCWFLRGHNLFNFVRELLTVLIFRSLHPEEGQVISDEKLEDYRKIKESVAKRLAQNQGFSEAALFQKILGDIATALAQPST